MAVNRTMNTKMAMVTTQLRIISRSGLDFEPARSWRSATAMLASPMITMAAAHARLSTRLTFFECGSAPVLARHAFPGVLLGEGHDRHGHEEQQAEREGDQTARPVGEPTVDAAIC